MRVHFINLDRSPDRLAEFKAVNGHLSDIERFSAVDEETIDLSSLVSRGLVEDDILSMYPIGAVGAALSARALWDFAIESGQNLTIAVDDATFHFRFEHHATEVIESLPADWDLVLWGWNFDLFMSFTMLPGVSYCVAQFDERQMMKNAEQFQCQALAPRAFKLLWAFGMPCYTISPKGARAFKARCFPLRPMVVQVPEGIRAPPHSEHFRTVGFDNTMNSAYRHLNSFVCFPPLVIAKNGRSRSIIQISTEVSSAAAECRQGDAFARENRLAEALACYDRALAVDADHVQALNNRGMVLHRLKRLDEALLCFDRMLALNRHVAETHFNRGAMLQELNRLTEALSSYDLMLALKPDFVPALNNRALVLWHMKMYDAALASCDRALAVKPDDQSALRNREFILQDVQGRAEGR